MKENLLTLDELGARIDMMALNGAELASDKDEDVFNIYNNVSELFVRKVKNKASLTYGKDYIMKDRYHALYKENFVTNILNEVFERASHYAF